MGVDKMEPKLLTGNKRMKDAISNQHEQFIKSLPEEEKKEIKNIRRKIKRMSKKC